MKPDAEYDLGFGDGFSSCAAPTFSDSPNISEYHADKSYNMSGSRVMICQDSDDGDLA